MPVIAPTAYATVQLDDVYNGGTWPYDITSKVRLVDGYQISTRGRADELSGPQPVTLTLTLENLAGEFSLGSTSAGYGAINVDRGIRVLMTVNGATTTRFTGFVQAWPVSWPDGSGTFSTVAVTALDAMARWSRRTLLSLPEEEIPADSPLAYYTLGDPQPVAVKAGTTFAADSAGQGASSLVLYDAGGFYAADPNPTLGTATGPATDGLTAAQFNGGGKRLRAPLPSTACTWIECAYLTSYSADTQFLVDVETPNQVIALRLRVQVSGQIAVEVANAATVVLITGPVVADGRTHSAAAVVNPANGMLELYSDGVLVASTAWTNPPSGGVVEVGQLLVGTIAHVVVGGGTPPTAARFAAHAQSLVGGFAGESSGLRVARLARYEGSSPSAVDTGNTNVPFIDITGKSVADAIQQVADAEQGVAYIDGQGRTVLHNRNRAGLKVSPDFTVQVDSDILDTGTGIQADTQQVINFATGNRASDNKTTVTQTVMNQASQKTHGRYPQSFEYLVATDEEVVQRLNWLIKNHAEPTPRIPDLTLDLLTADSSTQAAVMALDIDSRIQVNGLPSQSPTGVLADLTILGYAESFNSTSWTWTANTVSWPTFAKAAVLDNSTFGLLDSMRLGV